MVYAHGEGVGVGVFEKKMSSGVKGVAASSGVSIPSSVKKTIEDIKEIIGQKHSEDEIYAMLKECSMDPNEAAQKLLLLDTFHEVKKKRDRRKENLNKEPAESRWKPASQAWANRAGRGNYSSWHGSHDPGGGRNSSAVRGSSRSYVSEKLISKVPLATAQDVKKNEASSIARPITDISDGPSGVSWQSTNSISKNHVFATGGVNQFNETGLCSITKLEGPLPFSSPAYSVKNSDALGTRDMQLSEMLDTSNSAISLPPSPALPSSDPEPLPSQKFPLSSAVGTTRNEVESQHTPVEIISDTPTDKKSDLPLQQKMPNDFQGVEETRYLDSLQTASSVSRPSSNCNNRSQVVGPQKVGFGKEWKPKSASPSGGQGANVAASSKVSPISVGGHPELQHIPSEKATPELQRKLEELHLSNSQHVIIPNHLHVPEAGKLGFCFGSFDASFGLDVAYNGSIGKDNSPPLSESSEATNEPVKENTEINYHDHAQSPSQEPEHFSSREVEVSSSVTPEYDGSRQEVAPGSHQHLVADTSSNYNYGFMPSIFSGEITPFESRESQARDVSRLPGYVVQQSIDPMSYYAQFYQSSVDSDGRISPLHFSGGANKYNGNAAVVSEQASEFSQEFQSGAPVDLSTASPVPLVTQAAGVKQSSITTSQQVLPVFQQPTGVHIPHYPPFIPYGPYFSPFYVPPQAIHQFLSNGAFPQQPQGGSLYPTPPETTARYSVSQYKQGSNTGSSTHVGVPGHYGLYSPFVGNYNSGSVTVAVTTMSNEDHAASQVNETDIYVSAQQSEGFTPAHPGHGTFTNISHPA